jgi:hypothetical protein
MMKHVAIQRYEWAHERAFPERGQSNYRIPFQVMRDYLDTKAALKAMEAGLHNITITITPSGNISLLDSERLLDTDIAIRIQGQKWVLCT